MADMVMGTAMATVTDMVMEAGTETAMENMKAARKAVMEAAGKAMKVTMEDGI